MRFRFKPTAAQRTALRAQRARLNELAPVVKILGPCLPAASQTFRLVCTPQSTHSDRFVVRVQACSDAGEVWVYALKVYADDFGERVWAHGQALAEHYQQWSDGPCVPLRYVAHERTLVLPWVDGAFLSDIVDERKLELVQRAARLAADLHRLGIVPERPTTARMVVDETRERCDRLRRRWPEATPIVEPLLATLEAASTALDPADPAPIHGDMAAGQFLWTGARLVLLDLDMFGYADPAYDAGHFLAQLERRCLFDRTLPEHASQWVERFRSAYLAAMPTVSPRNVAFYQGVTLVRKIYTVCRREPVAWPELVPQLATRADVALRDVMSPRRAP